VRVHVRDSQRERGPRGLAIGIEMRYRRFAQISTSDDDEEAPPKQRLPQSSNSGDESQPRRKRLKRMKQAEEEEEPKEKKRQQKKRKKGREASEDEEEAEEEEPQQEDAKPIGEPVRFSGKGRGRRSHYEAFEFDYNRYELVRSCRLVELVRVLILDFDCNCCLNFVGLADVLRKQCWGFWCILGLGYF
jgi:hypothetical protein